MEKKLHSDLTKRYEAAADSFVDKVKGDPNIIAVIICGSLAYDQVWERSDIDMAVVVRDQPLNSEAYCITEDNITINASIYTRSSFIRSLEKFRGGSAIHSYFAKGKIIYSTDQSLYEFFEEHKQPGFDDLSLTVFTNACELIYYYEKCLKWLTIKKDPLYSQYYLLKAADVMARMEVCIHGESPTREAIRKAHTLNPNLLLPYYYEAMSHHYSTVELLNAIHGINQYLDQNIPMIQKPVLEFLQDHQMKTVHMFSKYFHLESAYMIGILEYLANKGVIFKVSQTIKLTPKSKMAVEEIAYQIF